MQTTHTEVEKIVSHLFRSEAGKMASVLTRLLGFNNYETAEDIVQDTLVQAMASWKFKGVPDNPTAWLYTVAKRKAIDELRKQKVRQNLDEELSRFLSSEYSLAPTVNQFFLENEIQDSQLRMIFALCHPAIPYDSQIALALKTLCGMSIGEIARAFLVSEETISKRLFRAREKIKEQKINLAVPPPSLLLSRLDAVHHSIYLLFNEGYNSSHPELLIREDLCAEAIRLGLILSSNEKTNTPETNALLSLMCLQAARQNARLDEDRAIVLLKDQDRAHWNPQLIEKGLHYLNIATASGGVSAFHIEAAIAAYHAVSKSFDSTEWEKIVSLYEALEQFKSHPVIQLNKAIAMGRAFGPDVGLNALLKIEGLNESHLYYSALGDFYLEQNSAREARLAYSNALTFVTSNAERTLLEKKLSFIVQ